MNVVALVAILAAALSIAVKVIGMPAQIRYNHARKSTEGLSNSILYFTLISYGMWVWHGYQVHDMSLVIGQGLGVIATAVILWQVYLYRRTTPKNQKERPVVLWYKAMLTKSHLSQAAKTKKEA